MSVFLIRYKSGRQHLWTTVIHVDLSASGWTKKVSAYAVHMQQQEKQQS